MAEVYRQFTKPWWGCAGLDFSDEAAAEMYAYETFGKKKAPRPANLNGFAVGKKWMDVAVSMWIEDMHLGLLWRHELHGDPQPALKISDDFPYVSDRFRAEWNSWALERFGTTNDGHEEWFLDRFLPAHKPGMCGTFRKDRAL